MTRTSTFSPNTCSSLTVPQRHFQRILRTVLQHALNEEDFHLVHPDDTIRERTFHAEESGYRPQPVPTKVAGLL